MSRLTGSTWKGWPSWWRYWNSHSATPTARRKRKLDSLRSIKAHATSQVTPANSPGTPQRSAVGGQGLTCAPEVRIKQPAAQRLGDSTRGTNQRARAGSPLQQTGQPPPGVQGSYAPNPQPTSKLQHAQPDPVPSSPGTSTHDLELEASRALHRRGYPPR